MTGTEPKPRDFLGATPDRLQPPNRQAANRNVRGMFRQFIQFVAAVILIGSFSNPSHADEFSILQNSTVIGRNYGLPPVVDFSSGREIGDLSFVAESVFYAKNLELTGSPNIDGETFIGVVAPMRLNYLASEQVQIEIGGYVGRNYGDDDSLDIAQPLARVIYSRYPQQYLIAGSLIQTHWIHDALRDDVVLFRDESETGLQYRANTKRFKADYWIDWRVRETVSRSEQFDGAGSNQLRLGQLWVDGHFLWSHTGGQKNSMGQIANSSSGMVGLSYGFGNADGCEPTVRLGASFLASNFESRTSPTISGNGIEYWVNYQTPIADFYRVNLYAKHFAGGDFFATRGDPLYRFDQYSQAGFDWVASLPGNLDLELGFVGQYADDNFMNTYKINFVWQSRFRLKNLLHSEPVYEFQPLPESTGN